MSARLTRQEDIILRWLIERGAQGRAITLEKWCRTHVIGLWRRGLVEIWYRQAVDAQPSLQGPYYGLTLNGAYIASTLFPAPRGSSGVESEL